MKNQSQTVQGAKLRITARGQAVLVSFVAIVLAVVVAFFTFGTAGANAATESGSNEFTYVSIHAGETLWDVALELDPNADPRDLIAEIMQLNALDSSDVEVGQRIALPERYS